ncbi:hypothetical protein EXT48_11860 [Pseudoalteromonas sp. CO348]|uniref:Uncharacterized protein n=1 Tax=Pseudoalteromonas maricaloris TaxID=184924 RepID=A0A8I2H092_9GAMM|nr:MULTISPECIES: hypothetical protein [Pseudoalteromonas]MCG7538443.1 hypothetical protein [Pseudoalteromonas sp. OF7H-1]NLR20771.1 hypothetical protein [Pseudoalteromonas maricaloris]ODB34069.1 hypothetical protein BB427_20290 [Pseudoalteromonas sp. BMB]QZO13923.1 hypothetical protein K5642_05265 [Pseudoalteromonas piscicida]RZG04557.1 hypothetical protein EXT48_11860 [Pseudoalteromonas sp. CO348]
MKIKLNKKPLKNLNNAQAIAPQATPQIGGGINRLTDLDCVPTNRHDCRTGAISCYGDHDCAFTNRQYMCD